MLAVFSGLMLKLPLIIKDVIPYISELILYVSVVQVIVNFMHLITAVRLANMRVMTETRIQKFEFHFRAYLTELADLYPHTRITPYQHMALHFGDLLRRFGPVHSWRCFGFERLNYTLQKFPTNSKFGDLEKTMFTRFCMMQRLKSSLHDPNLPSEFEEFSALYRDTFEETDARGTRITDALAFEEHSVFTHETSTLQRLSPAVYSLLQRWIDGSYFRGAAPIFVQIHTKSKCAARRLLLEITQKRMPELCLSRMGPMNGLQVPLNSFLLQNGHLQTNRRSPKPLLSSILTAP